MGSVGGFGEGEEDEDKRTFVQTVFNRLMFVYFLSRKGMAAVRQQRRLPERTVAGLRQGTGRQAISTATGCGSLFFDGLNNPNSRDVTEGLRTVIGDVPFLNGGLFEETDLDRRNGITVS